MESVFSSIAMFKTAAEMADYATATYPLQKQDEYPEVIKPVLTVRPSLISVKMLSAG